jgi:hypothetical protein
VILNVVDANGAPQQVCVAAPGLATDYSGTVSANLPSVSPTYQQVIPAPASGVIRSGWLIQNHLAADVMYVTEDGSVPSSTNPTAIQISPGQTFPPPGVGYPVSQNPIYLAGTSADKFSAKAW